MSDCLVRQADFTDGGLLDALKKALKKALAERALNAKMDYHLRGEAGAGNSRNDFGRKTVLTDTGWISLEVTCDRQGSFNRQPIAKYQGCFPGFDEKLLIAVRSTDARARNERARDRRPRARAPRRQAALRHTGTCGVFAGATHATRAE